MSFAYGVSRNYKEACDSLSSTRKFMGWIPRFKQYIPFTTEKEYKEFFKEMENNHENSSN